MNQKEQDIVFCLFFFQAANHVFFALAMFAPGVPDLMLEFRSTSEELAAFCVSVYVLGFAAGPMFFAPLSEIYGRSIIYNITNVGFIGRMSMVFISFWNQEFN